MPKAVYTDDQQPSDAPPRSKAQITAGLKTSHHTAMENSMVGRQVGRQVVHFHSGFVEAIRYNSH
jgi:hypothetical protein